MTDVWARDPDDWIVIPTNAGWKGVLHEAVMGAGLAKQALALPGTDELPFIYGNVLFHAALRSDFGFVMPWNLHRLILFPTKPLNRREPYLSWQRPASLACIEASTRKLIEMIEQQQLPHGRILVPPVGCGLGGLAQAVVLPLLTPLQQASDRVVLVGWAP